MKNKIKILATKCPPLGACPGIYEMGNDVLIVGVLTDISEYPDLDGRVAKNERIVKIPKELFLEAKSS